MSDDLQPQHIREGLRAGDAIRARIRELAKRYPSVNAFAAQCQIPTSMVQRYLKDEVMPGIDKLEQIAQKTNASFEWLVAGRGPKYESKSFDAALQVIGVVSAITMDETEREWLTDRLWAHRQLEMDEIERIARVELESLRSGPFEIPDKSLTHGSASADLAEYTSIPRRDVMAAAGDAVLLPHEEIVDYLLFKTSWLRRDLGIDPKRAVVVQAKGDSMRPSIRDGDLLLVEVLQETASDDGIYVINVGGRVMVKRLQFLIDRSIKVVSDNPAYEPQVVKDDGAEGFWIVGRVVWSGSRL